MKDGLAGRDLPSQAWTKQPRQIYGACGLNGVENVTHVYLFVDSRFCQADLGIGVPREESVGSGLLKKTSAESVTQKQRKSNAASKFHDSKRWTPTQNGRTRGRTDVSPTQMRMTANAVAGLLEVEFGEKSDDVLPPDAGVAAEMSDDASGGFDKGSVCRVVSAPSLTARGSS